MNKFVRDVVFQMVGVRQLDGMRLSRAPRSDCPIRSDRKWNSVRVILNYKLILFEGSLSSFDGEPTMFAEPVILRPDLEVLEIYTPNGWCLELTDGPDVDFGTLEDFSYKWGC